MENTKPETILMTRTEVAKLVGLSIAHFDKLVKNPSEDFPKPLQLGRQTRRWLRSEVEEWALSWATSKPSAIKATTATAPQFTAELVSEPAYPVLPALDGFTLICPCIDPDGDVFDTYELPIIGWQIGAGGMSFPLCPMETPKHFAVSCPTPDGKYCYVSSWLDYFSAEEPSWFDFFCKRLNKSNQE